MISINSLNSLVSDWRAGVRMEAFCNVGRIMAPPSKGGGTGWGGKKMVSDPCSEWTTSRRPMSNLWSWLCGLAQAREFWGWGITRQPNSQGSTAEETPTPQHSPNPHPLGQRLGRELQPLGPGRP